MSTPVDAAHRLESLDVLRGLTIAGMILVNNPGDWSAAFPPLLHAYWTGWTFADLVFPAFVFIMGAAMPIAFGRRRAAGASTREMYWKTGRRAAVLIALGLVLNAAARSSTDVPLRLPGVLQRIALAYLLASPIVLHLRAPQWLPAAATLLVGHWALLVLVPFGGHGAGTLTPEANLAGFVDTWVFGRHALTIPNDPEGLLGTLPAAATVLFGAAAGELLRRLRRGPLLLCTLVAGGALLFGAGLAWSNLLPISKPLWTGSFVLVAAGLTAIALAIVSWAVDVRRVRAWAQPLLWLGVNPLAIYVCAEIAGRLLDGAWLTDGARMSPKAWLFWEWLEPAFRPWPALASLTFGVAFVAFWTIAAGALYRARIRVAV